MTNTKLFIALFVWILPRCQTNISTTTTNFLKLSAIALVLATTQVQANDLLNQCDFNKNWKIDTKQDYKAWLVSKDIAKKEFKCGLKYEIAQQEKDIAKWKKRIVQLDIDWKKIAEDWNKIAEDWKKIAEDWKKIAEIISLLKNK